jgi:hypothetical protein
LKSGVVLKNSWAQEQAIQHVDFIKMDIEGGEYRALRGAGALLGQHRPLVVTELNEVCLACNHRGVQDVLSLLRAAGYDTFSFNRGVLGIPKDSCNQAIALHDFTRRPLFIQGWASLRIFSV